MIESLLIKKEAIQCSGKIYSEEHRRKFDIKNDVFRVEKHPMDSGKLILTINRIQMENGSKSSSINYGKVYEDQQKSQEKAEDSNCNC